MQQQVSQARTGREVGPKAYLRITRTEPEALRQWILAIPFEEWPQQRRLEDGKIRPSMVTDLEWHDFGRRTDETVRRIMFTDFQGCRAYQRMLSVVMPGHSIPAHIDEQDSKFVCRVHVPLTSNHDSFFFIEDTPFNFNPGFAYRVDTTKRHAVTNDGETPRIHFMFDVGEL
jgi:hypothetical protein